MTHFNDQRPGANDISIPFEAVLTPHRSLSRTAFLICMVAVGITSFVSGVLFLIAGAWPVTFFFGLDFLLIYWAFKLNYRDGKRYETIRVTRSAVTLTQVDARGASRYRDFPTTWVQIARGERKDGRFSLAFSDRGERIAFGDFLTDDERREFAEILGQAIFNARTGARV
jgi:uncharacterized membrane protein